MSGQDQTQTSTVTVSQDSTAFVHNTDFSDFGPKHIRTLFVTVLALSPNLTIFSVGITTDPKLTLAVRTFRVVASCFDDLLPTANYQIAHDFAIIIFLFVYQKK